MVGVIRIAVGMLCHQDHAASRLARAGGGRVVHLTFVLGEIHG
jgi:hypothetical protein